MRVAAVDLGTNTTRLLVADVDDGRVDEVVAPARRSRGSARASTSAAGCSRSRSRASATCLADYRREARGARRRADARGRRRAPSATPRTARRSSARSSGATGSRRACSPARRRRELTFRGVAGGRDARAGTLVVDIGGGSTELIGAASSRTSLDVGSRAADRAVPASDPPTRDELERGRAARPRRCLPALEPARAIGVAGTVTTLAALELGSASTTRSGSTATGSRATASTRSSSGSPRSARRAARACRRSSRSARP